MDISLVAVKVPFPREDVMADDNLEVNSFVRPQ